MFEIPHGSNTERLEHNQFSMSDGKLNLSGIGTHAPLFQTEIYFTV